MKEKQREEAEKMQKILKDAENHPLMLKIKAERAAEVLAQRRAAAAKIADLKKGLGAHAEKQAEIDTMEDQLAALDAERKNLQMEINSNRGFIATERLSIEAQVRALEAKLEETADPAIDEAIDHFQKKLTWLRTDGRISKNAVKAETNIFTMTKATTVETNYNAVMAALEYCQRAIKVLERMRHVPDLDADIIENMKKAIPDVTHYEEITGEKDIIEPIGENHPLVRMAEDNEHDWKMGKLNEKFKKLMGRPW